MTRVEEENSESIPFDLVIEILTRLPSKSIARFCCVSKLWNSTLRGSNFTESFFTISSSRPKLMFTCLKDDETFFFTSTQPQTSSPIAVVTSHASSHMRFPISYPFGICRPVRGLLCGLNQQKFKGGHRVTVPFICNPSTGQSLPLPRVKTRRKQVFSYLGYDPIDKQFKVLCMTKSLTRGFLSEEHQVLTLEFGKKQPSWRMIECGISHSLSTYGSRVHDGICINGVLYYVAFAFADHIVCFDIRYEKFKSIRIAQSMPQNLDSLSPLANYKGKLAILQPNHFSQIDIKNLKLWVLEDAEKSQWLSYVYVLPRVEAAWSNIVKEAELRFVGTTDTGEIVLSPEYMGNTFFLIYLNIEKDTITRVEIQGIEWKTLSLRMFIHF